MTLTTMLHEMCQEVLSAADLKAIGKSRGFSDQEVRSRSQFESVFLSPTGLEEVMNTLTAAEVAALHLLHVQGYAVGVNYFFRLYRSAQDNYAAYGTYTQRLKPIFDAVHRNLVRKGLLILAPLKNISRHQTKMESWQYQFPPEFVPFLPSLFHASVHIDAPSAKQPDFFRYQLRRWIRGKSPETHKPNRIHLLDGTLMVGTEPFKASTATEARQEAWSTNIIRKQPGKQRRSERYSRSGYYSEYPYSSNTSQSLNPLRALLYAFSQLDPDEWIPPEDLTTLLDIFYGSPTHPTAEVICKAGWANNCLARYRTQEATYYRLAEPHRPPSDETPERYLPMKDGSVFVDPDRIPYEVLERLNELVSFTVDQNRLKIMPSTVKLIDTYETLQGDPLLDYLAQHSLEFQTLLARIDQQWGRLILHHNLLIARITDFSLRVRLQKAFESPNGSGASLIFFQDEYIAFPQAMRGEIERWIKKAGYVIKTVQAKS